MIVIIDYKTGNTGSILNMLKKIDVKATISSDVSDIERADKLILAGVGSFDNGIRNINDSGLLSILEEKVLKNKTPILGICLGMQLFCGKSEEGKLPGLGWINDEVIRFKFDENQTAFKIPHMGWNNVFLKKNSPLCKDIDSDSRFYFAHSYHLVCEDKKDILMTTFYGYEFISAIQKDNIFGAQFHPEKSHKFGMQLLRNFANF